MLSIQDNEVLCRVGPGTPMGELLRRYWTPACLSAEIPEPGGVPARVRLLGENLVAFRDTSGRIGLLQENCPHRGASLYFGRNEDAAIRCVPAGKSTAISPVAGSTPLDTTAPSTVTCHAGKAKSGKRNLAGCAPDTFQVCNRLLASIA